MKTLIIAITLFLNMGNEMVITHEIDTNAVVETFVIHEETETEIRGELLNGTGEGIYLDETYTAQDWDQLKEDIKVGSVINVHYDKEDYENEIWDNILKIEVLN